jgi:hypothetical protein
MLSKQVRVSLLAGAAALGLGLAGCSGSNNATGPTTQGASLTQAQADSIGSGIAQDVQSETEGATLTGIGGSPGSFFIGPLPGGLPNLHFGMQQCIPTVSPTPVVDSDSDGVPDSVRVDFTGCITSTPFMSLTLSGTIDVIDPTATIKDHARKRVYTDFTRTRVNILRGDSSETVQNGIELVYADTSTIERSEPDFKSVHVFANGDSAVHTRTWSSTFTADVVGSIQRDAPLPSGTWNITGSSSWVRGDHSRSFAITTNPVLHYNASCTVAPKFDAGTLTAVVTKGGAAQTITVQFTACGQYTVTKS